MQLRGNVRNLCGVPAGETAGFWKKNVEKKNYFLERLHYYNQNNFSRKQLQLQLQLQLITSNHSSSYPKMLSHHHQQSEFVLFVGGLPPNCAEGDLWGLFSEFGPVQDLAVKEKFEGNYVELYSLVTYSEEVCAANALRSLNGFNFYGYQLK